MGVKVGNGIDVALEVCVGIEVEIGGPSAGPGRVKKVRLALRRRALWICGYISPSSFKAGKHGWIDPQKFIKDQLAKPGVNRRGTEDAE